MRQRAIAIFLPVVLVVHYYTFTLLFNTAASSEGCDSEIYSRPASKTGTIQSPGYPYGYDRNLRCLFYLIGQSNERVQLIFEEFEVKGVLPSCLDDYVDVYTRVRRLDQNLLNVSLHGRYCGSDKEKLPNLLISMTNILVVGFYTVDMDNVDTNYKGFLANYSFIDDSVYNVGTPAPGTDCGQTVNSTPSGVLLSPTYPGMYPDHIFCFYKISGSLGQRIRLTFTDIDLYSGGEHCPFDYIKVFDGPNNTANEIDTYCGSIQDNVTIYSTGPSVDIVFVTKSGRAEPTKKPYYTYDEKQATEVERRGFRAEFDISDSFVKLNDAFISGSHVRGTECDQVIFSRGETSGTVTSPYYPNNYPLNVRCIYYIDGLQDKQHLEKVSLTITDMNIPHSSPTAQSECDGDGGYLLIYTEDIEGDRLKRPHKLCRNITSRRTFTTTNPRLLMVFDSGGHVPGLGFNATYQFITDYAIPGTPATSSANTCSFTYESSSGQKVGTFFSPRHPSYYPDGTNCKYEFRGLNSEQVRLTFENFDVENGNASGTVCRKDRVQVYDVARRPTSGGPPTRDTLVGVYCGNKLPGPQMSEQNSSQMKVLLITDKSGQQTHVGFRAKYEFVKKTPDTETECMKNITGSGGTITSPNHPHKYYTNRTCEWNIYSRYRHGTIMLIIQEFRMEGNPDGVGCGNCVLKIYTNDTGLPGYELCGEKKSYAGMTILSQYNRLRLKFISSAKAVGGKGFILSWTELLPGSGEPDYECSDGFQCKSSHYCIAKELQCNKLPNCGHGDTSDETDNCGHAHARGGVLNIILAVVLTAIVIVVIAFCVVHWRRRRLRRQKQDETVTVHFLTAGPPSLDHHRDVNSEPTQQQQQQPMSAAVNGGRNLFTEQTEKVSIV